MPATGDSVNMLVRRCMKSEDEIAVRLRCRILIFSLTVLSKVS